MRIIKGLNLPILIFLIVALSQLVYVNSLSNQFTYDDEFTIVNNYCIKSLQNIPNLFSKEYFALSGELSYRPVVTLSYFIDYALWKLNPFGFHLTNSLLHTLNSVLFFFLLAWFSTYRHALSPSSHTKISFIGALIFSCHPALSEAVNAISYREDLLAGTFFLSAFILSIKAKKQHAFLPYLASAVCYLFGIFSKEMVITLPLCIFFSDILLMEKRGYRRILSEYLGYILVTILYILMRFVFLHNPIESHVSYPNDSIITNFLTMSKVLVSYIKLFFFPFNLNADYVMPYSSSLSDISFILSFLLLSLLIVIVYRLFFHSKILFFSIVWFFISLLPVLNIVPIENIMAERYLYIPILGFCIAGSNLLVSYGNKIRFSHTFARTNRWIIFILLILVLASFSIKTIKRNKIWMDQTILWTQTAQTSPHSFKAHNNLGNIYRNTDRFDEAIHEFKHALSLYDDYLDAHNNLGVTYRKKGMQKEAISEYEKVLQLSPRYPYAHNNLGVLYARENLLDQSIAEFQNAISNKPDYPDAHNNLGATYMRKGMYEKAIHECLEAIKYNNRYLDAYYNLSAAYLNNKQLDKALEAIKIVLSMSPDHHDAREILRMISEQKR